MKCIYFPTCWVAGLVSGDAISALSNRNNVVYRKRKDLVYLEISYSLITHHYSLLERNRTHTSKTMMINTTFLSVF